MIVVIDGPSGSGKSSTAKAVAEMLDIEYLDSGALYRAITLMWLNADRPSIEKFIDILSSKKIDFSWSEGIFNVQVDGVNLANEIRRPHVSEHVSKIATIPAIRRYVNSLMRQVVRQGRYIADGRDLGTVVFPDAELKIYMEASITTRAERRYQEMIESGEKITLDQVRRNLEQRDRTDSTREVAPLTMARDAVLIDSNDKTFDEQVSEVASLIRQQLERVRERVSQPGTREG